MFELMKISETINEGVVDPYYLKKTNQGYGNCYGHISKIR